MSKRRKAIRKRGFSIKTHCIIEKSESSEYEKYEIEIRSGVTRAHPVLDLQLWSDNWLIVWAFRDSVSGFKWQFKKQGRLFGEDYCHAFMNALENSLGAIRQDDDLVCSQLDAIWVPVVASGPKPID